MIQKVVLSLFESLFFMLFLKYVRLIYANFDENQVVRSNGTQIRTHYLDLFRTRFCVLRSLRFNIINDCYTGGYDGRTYLNTVRTFDPSTKEWSSITPMHYRRCFTTTVSMGTDLYVLAGFDGQQRLTSMEKYCTLTKQWTVVGSLNIPRSDGTAVVHNG